MKYQVIGISKSAVHSKKNGKYYTFLCIAGKDISFVGLHAETILLSEDTLRDADIQTESGEMYATDGKRYFVDIDYNNRGFIVGLRFYNEG